MFRKKKSEGPKPYSLADLHAHHSGRRRVRVWVFLLCGAILFTGSLYLVFLSSAFQVQDFVFSGDFSLTHDVLLQELEASIIKNNFLSAIFADNNILLWDQQNVGTLPSALSSIASIAIDRDFLKRIVTLTIHERERALIFCSTPDANLLTSSTCFWVDAEGRAFEEAPIARGGLVRVFRGSFNHSISLGERALEGEALTNLFSIFDLLDRFNFVVQELVLSDPGLQEVTGLVTEGPVLYFSLDVNPLFALSVIESLITSGEWNRISYLDLRVENKAYYSYR